MFSRLTSFKTSTTICDFFECTVNLAIEKRVKNSTKISSYDRGGLDTRVARQDSAYHARWIAIVGTAISTKKTEFPNKDLPTAREMHIKIILNSSVP